MYACTEITSVSIPDEELRAFFKNEQNFRNKIEDLQKRNKYWAKHYKFTQ